MRLSQESRVGRRNYAERGGHGGGAQGAWCTGRAGLPEHEVSGGAGFAATSGQSEWRTSAYQDPFRKRSSWCWSDRASTLRDPRFGPEPGSSLLPESSLPHRTFLGHSSAARGHRPRAEPQESGGRELIRASPNMSLPWTCSF